MVDFPWRYSLFPVREAPTKKMLVVSHWVNKQNPSFCATPTPSAVKRLRKGEAFSWFPNLLLLKAALSRLDVGPSLLRGSRIPYIVFLPPGSRGSYAAAFPGPFLLVLRPEAIASS